MTLRIAMLCVLLLSGSVFGDHAFAQTPGEKIYVVNNTELKSGPTTIGRVTAGNILAVEDVRDGWLRIHHKAYAADGWILRRDTVSVQEAMDRFTAQIETRPTTFAYVGRALVWKDRGELALASVDLDAAILLDPRNPYAFHTRGVVSMRQKHWARSIPDFDETLRLSTDPVVQRSAYHNRGVAHLRLKEFELAVVDFDACLRFPGPNQADAYANRGEARNFLNGNLDLALADLNEALRQNPKHEKAWSMRATNYGLRGDWDRALADFSQALLLAPGNVTALDNRGVIWETKGNLDQALLDFNAAIRLDPDFATAFRHRARIFEHRGELEKAAADLNDFVRFSQSQDRVFALVIRAGFHTRHDAVAMAQADLAEALLALDHKRPESLKEIAWFLATAIKPELRNGALATELAREACELTRDSDHAMLDVLAAAYAESGQFDKAVETQRRALALTADVKQRATYQEIIEHYVLSEPRTEF